MIYMKISSIWTQLQLCSSIRNHDQRKVINGMWLLQLKGVWWASKALKGARRTLDAAWRVSKAIRQASEADRRTLGSWGSSRRGKEWVGMRLKRVILRLRWYDFWLIRKSEREQSVTSTWWYHGSSFSTGPLPKRHLKFWRLRTCNFWMFLFTKQKESFD